MRIGVLGITIAADDRSTVAVGAPKQRALLAALALHRGQAVSVDALADLVWDGNPPAGAAGTLQGYVAGLRRTLEPDRSVRGAGTLIVTEQPGYALRVEGESLDAHAFEHAVATVHATTAPLAAALLASEPVPPRLEAGSIVELQATLADAVALWRATPYADLGDGATVAAERSRLEELRLLAQEDRAVLGLLLRRHAPVAAELEALTRQHPLRERIWALRAVALAGSGRQADALAVLRQVRDLLDDELGLEPGPELRAVQTAVLRQQTSSAPATGAASATPVPATHRPVAPWPLAGRDAELASLTAALDTVCEGAGPAFAALTGEPGIGKTRLASELVAYAAARDVRVVVGRCSQDDGAPALWPWATVLAELGTELPTSSGEVDGGAAFRAAQSIVDSVLDAAHAPLVVVLDDLHWADTSTLRVLRLLAESAPAAPRRLLVLATWREHPTPTGPLADVAESFARRHAVRLQLRGLGSADAARIVEEVAHAAPTDQEAADLCRRTDGNPFFLVEYARLAGEGDDLATLMAEADPPAAVHEVLVRRLDRLAAPTRELLHGASVIGRVFEVDVLAATSGLSDDAVLDHLDHALDAGLVTEDGVDRFRFTHALVRDTALTMLPQSRRARVHAQAAAALTGRPGREAEIAHHWLEAGPRHQREAWRAASDAGAAAAGVHAYVEALEMLEVALAGQRDDIEATPGERFELLVLLAEVLRRAGRWIELRTVAHEAYEIALEIGDVDLEAVAGILTSTGALWQASESGSVDEVMVGWLRSTLDRLPSGDDERRCRLMLALASENYYGSTPQELSALTEEALAMADRLGHVELQLYACLQAAIVVWRSSTAPYRLDTTTRAIDLAREVDDELALVSAMTLRAVALGELGHADLSLSQSAQARAEAERIHHLYALLVLDSLDVGWLALRGEFGQVETLVAHMVEISQVVSITGTDEAIAGALTMQMLWQGRDEELVAALMAIEPTTWLPLATTLAAMMCRTGSVEDARAYFDAHPDQVAKAMHDDNWFSPMAWCLGAEAALHLGEADLAATAYERLTALGGRPCCAGSGNTLGPADMFLAMAAAATGERALATRHAQRAEELCEEWQIPLAAQWVRRERDRWGF